MKVNHSGLCMELNHSELCVAASFCGAHFSSVPILNANGAGSQS